MNTHLTQIKQNLTFYSFILKHPNMITHLTQIKLYLYLEVSPHTMSSALVKEEGKAQKPVYYTNKVLRGVEG